MKCVHRSIVAARHPAVCWLLALLLTAGCGGSSGDPTKYLKLGQKHLNAGNKKKAIKAYSKAIQVDSKCKKAYVSRAMLYNELGEEKKAFADYSKAIKLDSRDSYPYEQRAKLYRKHNKPDKARTDEAAAAAIRAKQWDRLPGKRRAFENNQRRKRRR